MALRPPFWALVYRYGSEIRHEDDELAAVLRFAAYGSEAGEHTVDSIGDADGVLWDRPARSFEWRAHTRAPAPDPYEFAGLDVLA